MLTSGRRSADELPKYLRLPRLRPGKPPRSVAYVEEALSPPWARWTGTQAGAPGEDDQGEADRKRDHGIVLPESVAEVVAVAAGIGTEWPDAPARRWIAVSGAVPRPAPPAGILHAGERGRSAGVGRAKAVEPEPVRHDHEQRAVVDE